MYKRYRSPWISFFSLALIAALIVSASAQNTPSLLAGYDAQFKTGQVPRDGFELYYRPLGAGEPVLILSGGPGDDCDYMLPVASDIAKYADAILLEQRGTGRSLLAQVDKSTMDLTRSLEDFEALRKQLKVQRWTIVGHSAGGIQR